LKPFFWNVWGLNDTAKQQSFAHWLTSHQPLFGAILESHIKDHNLNHFMSTTCQGWNITSNHNSDEDGNIILIWKDTVDVTIKLLTRQSITCEVKLPYGDQFYYIAIYASNLTEERSNLWYLKLDMYPWFVGRDLNQIVHPVELSEPNVNSLDSQMMDLRDCLNQMGLYQGPLFTWTNCRPSSPIAKKLDSVLVNMQFVSNISQSSAAFFPPLISDHFPCILNPAVPLPTVGTRPFKFFNYITKHMSFLQVQKLIKGALKQLNRDNFSQIQVKVPEAYHQLQVIQIQPLQSPSPHLYLDERACHDKWNFLRFDHAINHFKSIIAPDCYGPAITKLLPSRFLDLLHYQCYHAQAEILEGSLHNLKRKFSWYSNKLLKLRDVALTWMKRRVRDRNTTRFWSDNWTPFRSLLSFLATPCRPSRLGISQNATISSIFRNGYWAQPPARSDNFVNLQTYLTTVQLSKGEDTYEWVIEDIPKKRIQLATFTISFKSSHQLSLGIV
ncbi:unnamed protein product, partial [Thlaspi arvense]